MENWGLEMEELCRKVPGDSDGWNGSNDQYGSKKVFHRRRKRARVRSHSVGTPSAPPGFENDFRSADSPR
jgi:hypothetical protein